MCWRAGTRRSRRRPRLKFVVNGTLGDKSFFDSAAAGLDELRGMGDASVEIIEIGYDRTRWRPGFEDAAAADDYDILVAGTFDSVDIIASIAPQYPDKKFWVVDAPVDYSGASGGCSNGCENVFSIMLKQNEGGFLAGLLAAGTVRAAELPGQESARRAGFIGGAELPVIQDLMVGFLEGWLAGGGAPSDLLASTSAATRPSPTRLARRTLRTRCSVREPHAEQRDAVVTSVLKNVGVALLEAFDQESRGVLPYGEAASLELKESAVGLSDNDHYLRLVPEHVRVAVAEAASDIAVGTIVVPSALS